MRTIVRARARARANTNARSTRARVRTATRFRSRDRTRDIARHRERIRALDEDRVLERTEIDTQIRNCGRAEAETVGNTNIEPEAVRETKPGDSDRDQKRGKTEHLHRTKAEARK